MKSCVLHIGKYFPPYPGGMENYLRDLMAAQARMGVTCSALVHQSRGSLKSQQEDYRAGAQSLAITRAAVWARALFTPISPTFPLSLSRTIRQRQPDILHLHLPNVSAFWALLLPRARKLPWVVHWHSDVPASRHSLGLRLFLRLYKPFERAVLKRADVIIVTSQPYLDSSEPLAEFRDKCRVVPLGIDPANLPAPQQPEPEGDAESSLRVLAIGRLSYYKGFEYLIRAVAQCEQLQLHLVGEGEQEHKLKALANTLGVDARVHFHGYLTPEQLSQQFQNCDCLCLPSIERTEAFGMVLLEAMFHGKATVVSSVAGSGMSWVVAEGITGLVCESESADSLSAALLQLHENPKQAQLLGRNGQQRFEQLFHIERSAHAVSAIYKDLPAHE